jgi:putative ABC transport system permease protein
MASLAVRNLFHDKIRLAVTITGIVFSVVLVAIQAGLFIGFTNTTANIIDHSNADLWITAKGVPFIEVAPAFSENKLYRARALPEVAEAQKYIVQYSGWKLRDGSHQNCEIVAFEPGSSMGKPWNVVAGSINDLRVPYTVFIDRFYAQRLGAMHIGDTVEIGRARARVVGFTTGIRTFTTTPLVFTSLRNGYDYTHIPDDKAQFVLIRAVPGTDLEKLRVKLRDELGGVDVWTRQGFADLTTRYWMFGTGAGIAVLLGGLLGLLVGVVVVAQTIYAATMDHIREFGTLKAMGATNWYVYKVIFKQAIISAVIGYVIALGIAIFLASKGEKSGANIVLPPVVLAGLLVLTIVMCLAAAMVSINKVTRIDPAMVFKG